MGRILQILIVMCLSTSLRAQLIRGPYLQAGTPSSMVIRWRTDVPTDSRVRYGTNTNDLAGSVEDPSLATEHEFKISGLLPGTRYFYSVGSSTATFQSDDNSYFETAPVIGKQDKYRFGFLGDCGTNSAIQGNTRDQLIRYLGDNYLNALMLLGDNAYSFGQDAEYQSNFFNHYSGNLLKKTPLFPSPGNHDYGNDNVGRQLDHKIPYYDNFTMPTQGEAGGLASGNEAYYSFDYGNVHFLSLDSFGKEDQETRLYDTLGRQVTWIKADLAANKNKDWIIAYWHHPPYTLGTHNSDQEPELALIRQNFIRILERNGVDLIICGHSHVYERSRLLNGHYDKTTTFDPSIHNKSSSSGTYTGSDNSCPYVKSSGSNNGTVYAVVGSSGQIGGVFPGFPQKAMFYSDADRGGSMLLEVEANRLDAKWIAADGQVRDQFTMEKNINLRKSIKLEYGSTAELTASFIGNYKWSTGEKSRKISVSPRVDTDYFVTDEFNCVADTFNVRVASTPVVKLNSFQGSASEINKVTLNWETASEPGLSNFTLEQSINQTDFVEVGKINSANKPDQKNSYSFLDNNAINYFKGELIYYRLKYIYLDGRSGYSPVVSVKLKTLPPFILTSLTGSSDADNNVTISWKTSYERQTKSFVLNRSLDRNDFTVAGNKEASGNSVEPKSYEFKDATSSMIIGQDSLFYQLQMIDASETTLVSDILGVRLNHTILAIDPAHSQVEIEIVPNPASKEEIQIRLTGRDKITTMLTINDVSGKVLSEKMVELTSTLTPFLPSGLSAGTYFVKVTIGERVVVRKFIIF